METKTMLGYLISTEKKPEQTPFILLKAFLDLVKSRPK